MRCLVCNKFFIARYEKQKRKRLKLEILKKRRFENVLSDPIT